MKVIILAAGKGSRLGKYTGGAPKCLLKLGSESILEREIRLLCQAGIPNENIYVVGGYHYEMLNPIAPNLIINDQFDTKDNAYSLGLALETVVDDDVLVLDADLCFETDLLNEIINETYKNVLLSKISHDLDESTGIVIGEDGFVKAIGKQYTNTGLVYVSIFKISKDTIPALRKALLNERSERTWYPLAITEICSKYKFVNKTTEQKWHEIDFEEDYLETLELFGLEVPS